METWDRRKTGWLIVLLGAAVLAALYWASLARRPVGSNVEQLRRLMVQGERAIEERNLSAAMGLVSRAYRDDQGLRYGSLRALAGRQMRQADRIEITLPARLLRVYVDPSGKRATGDARVDLHIATRFDTVHDLSANLSLQFVKEPVRYYWLFPSEEWRLVKMEGWQGLVSE
jgi:hypothetical protein